MLIGVLVIVVSLLNVSGFVEVYNRYSTILEPIKYHVSALTNDAHEGVILLRSEYNSANKKALREISEEYVPEKLKRLQELGYELGNDENYSSEVALLSVDFSAYRELVRLKLKGKEMGAQVDFENESAAASKKVINRLNDLSNWHYSMVQQCVQQLLEIAKRMGYQLAGLSLIAAAVLFSLMKLVNRSIVGKVGLFEKELEKLSTGNIPDKVEENNDELKKLAQAINFLSSNLKNVKRFAQDVGDGNYNTEVSVFENKGELGEVLSQMKERLRQISEIEKQRIWANEGIAQFEKLIRENSESIDELAVVFTRRLVKYVGANQATLYLVEENRQEEVLRLKATYAYNRRKYVEKTIKPGEGMLGQVYLEKEPAYMTEVPEAYLEITSGLGESLPKNILIVPMLFNEKVQAVIELASFEIFDENMQQFIGKVGDSFAASVNMVHTNEQTKQILEESQVMTEQLRAQEEELRQNTEELIATQEQLNREIRELREENRKIRELA